MSLKKHTLIWICGCLVFFSDGQQLHENIQKLNISVYLESLCPDSEDFITNKLHPHWNDIKDYVNIRFIPFGKSRSLEGGKKFACQHGPRECRGNRIMACTLSRMPDQELQVQYVRCFMDVYKLVTVNKDEDGRKCAELLGLNFTEIMHKCYHTSEGTKLQLEAEADTKKVFPKFIPTVVYNESFDQNLQNESMEDFRETVCNLIHQTYPEACSYKTVISI